MSSTAKFTPNQQSQHSAQQQQILNSTESTKTPKWLAVDSVVQLLGNPSSQTSCTLYLETVTGIPTRSYVHRDLIYDKSKSLLQQWWAPMGNSNITNNAYNNTQFIAAVGVLEDDSEILWKPNSTLSHRMTCSVNGVAPTLTVTFPQAVSSANYLTLALRSTTFSGIKSYDVLVDATSYRVDCSQPDAWGVLSNVPAGSTILIQPSSPTDVQAGDVFYLAPVWVTSSPVDSAETDAFEFANYVPAWQVVDADITKRLMDQVGTDYTSAASRVISYGSAKPTTRHTGDLWVDSSSTPTMMICINGDFYPSDDPDTVKLFNVLATTLDLSAVQNGLDQVQADQVTNTQVLNGVQTNLNQAQIDLYQPGGKVDLIQTTLTGVQDDASTAVQNANAAGQQALDAYNTAQQASLDAKKAGAVVHIDSSRGLLFKQNTISTVLSVSIFKGDQVISDILALQAAYGAGAYLEWQWQRDEENAFGTISSSDSRIGSGGFTFTLSPDDVATKVVFRCTVNGDI